MSDDQQTVTIPLSKQLEAATDINACFCIGCGQPDEPDLHDSARCPARAGGKLDALTIADALEVYDTSCDEEQDLDGDARALHCAIVAARLASASSVSAEVRSDDEVIAEFAYLYHAYGVEADDKLAPDALELKRKVLAAISSSALARAQVGSAATAQDKKANARARANAVAGDRRFDATDPVTRKLREVLRTELERQCAIGAGTFTVDDGFAQSGLWQVNADLDSGSLIAALVQAQN